jgi:hypothetical protein
MNRILVTFRGRKKFKKIPEEQRSQILNTEIFYRELLQHYFHSRVINT